MTVTTVISPYHHYDSNYSSLPLSPLSQWRYRLGSSRNISQHIISVNISAPPYCQVGDKQEWSDNRDCVILGIATLPTVTVSLKTSYCLTQHTDILDNYIGNLCCDVLLSDPYKTQQDSHCETVEQWDSWLLTCLWCVLKEYLHVCYFLSFVDEAYCTAVLTFTNRTAHFVLHNSYCFSLPMKWHAGRFLCNTVNMLCGSLNRLLAVWQCTEILLYC